MIRIRLLPIFTLYLTYFILSDGKKPQGKFHVWLEHIGNCTNPSPAYRTKPSILLDYKLSTQKGRRLLSGNTTIISEIPYRNFSARSYEVHQDGSRTLKIKIEHVSCRNVFARGILLFLNAKYDKRSCLLLKGVYSYNNLDIDKIAHSIPNWHGEGRTVHQLQLASEGTTVYCVEISVNTQTYK